MKQNNHDVNNAHDLSYELNSVGFNEQKVIVRYPQVTGLSDDDRQKSINSLIKAEALLVISNLYGDTKDLSMEIDYQIMRKSESLLSIQYRGFAFADGAAYPIDLFYTTNIDMKKGCKIRISDFINIDNDFVEIIKNYKVENAKHTQASAYAVKYLKETSTEEIVNLLKGADSAYENSGFSFSYFKQDALGISIEVPHAIGDHAELEIKYTDISSSIKAPDLIR